MNKFTIYKILLESVQSLPVSREFKQMALTNNFNTLEDILNSNLDELHALPDSGYRILKELYALLKSYNLEKLLC